MGSRSWRSLVLVAVAVAACQQAPADPTPASFPGSFADAALAPRPVQAGPPPSLIADARLDRGVVHAFRRPSSQRPMAVFPSPNLYGHREVFLVDDVRPRWVRVLLPMRPNGATGWVRRNAVELRETSLKVVVTLSANRLSLWDGDRLLMRETVAAGTGGTPTPTGRFYARMLARSAPSSAYGPYIFALSGYSEVLFSFAGGDGMVGIHGTNDPSSIGQNVSHGCIRMRNGAIRKLADVLPLGAPVIIRA